MEETWSNPGLHYVNYVAVKFDFIHLTLSSEWAGLNYFWDCRSVIALSLVFRVIKIVAVGLCIPQLQPSIVITFKRLRKQTKINTHKMQRRNFSVKHKKPPRCLCQSLGERHGPKESTKIGKVMIQLLSQTWKE